MTHIDVCGWDIGGAHLKAVSMDTVGRIVDAQQIACPLWRGTEHLGQAMQAALNVASMHNARHVVTMTGELCDNFASRAEGVQEILDVIGRFLDPKQTRVYAGQHGWYGVDQVSSLGAENVGSANWRAMAEVVAISHENAMLIDVGSTTSDIVPILHGAPQAFGSDDASRLSHDELVYSGVVRTPLMALCEHVPFAGAWQRVAAEHFATTADIYRILGDLPEYADVHDTADGALKTITASARRVSRMLGRDLINDADAIRNAANYFAYCQFDLLQRALLAVQSRLGQRCEKIVAAGAGAFLVHKLARFNSIPCLNFSSLFDVAPTLEQAVMTCAPAAALAQLGRKNS